jgi:hypothetical protein
MAGALLRTISGEGLRPLGTPHQRSWDLVTGALRRRLGDRHADLFAEPVAAEHGQTTDWYAPMDGRVRALDDLPEEEEAALRAEVETLAGEIDAEAEVLVASTEPEDQRLGEALRQALEVPGPDCLMAVETGQGTYRPVLVGWAWASDARHAVRGALTGADARTATRARLAAAAAAGPAAMAAAPMPSRPVERDGLSTWIAWLGWLLLALMLASILWLVLTACGLRGVASFCPAPPPERTPSLAIAAVLRDEISEIERRIAAADRACQPEIVQPIVLPPPPVAPPLAPDPAPAPASEIDRRLDRAGARRGDLSFSLAWNSRSDLDLHVTCPDGQTISYRRRQACSGELDVDANAGRTTPTPVENVVFDGPRGGGYRLRVHLYAGRGASEPFELQVREGDRVQTFRGTVAPGNADWTTTYGAGGQ